MATWKKGRGESGRFNIRVDDLTGAFYRRKAQEAGISASEYLRQTLQQGVIQENVHEIEDRLKAFLGKIEGLAVGQIQQTFPENALLSIYTSEELLKAIVEARDPSQLYEAQERAKARVKRERGE